MKQQILAKYNVHVLAQALEWGVFAQALEATMHASRSARSQAVTREYKLKLTGSSCTCVCRRVLYSFAVLFTKWKGELDSGNGN